MNDEQRLATTLFLAVFAKWLVDDLDFSVVDEGGVPVDEVHDYLFNRADSFLEVYAQAKIVTPPIVR